MGASGTDDGRWLTAAVERYQRPLLSYATFLLRDRDRAADAVADTFARLCAETEATVDGHLAAWLFAVCRTRAIDMMRKDRHMTTLTTRSAETATTGGDPARSVERADTHSAALAAIATLPHQQQEVVRLKFQHDLSYRQIADVTGLSVTNVGYLLHVALRALRERMA